MSEFNTWIPPTTDRTLADVQNKTMRGTYSFDDINRVEWNTGYLAERIRELPDEITAYREERLVPYDDKYYPDIDTSWVPPVYYDYYYDESPPYQITSMRELHIALHVTAEYSPSLQYLTYINANAIERAQLKMYNALNALRQHCFDLIDADKYTEIFGGYFGDENENEVNGGTFEPWTSNENEISGGTFDDL